MGGRYALKDLIVEGASVENLVPQIQKLAGSPQTTFMLEGETGTGKEFIARVLHHYGLRRKAHFVGIKCMAIPKELFESELVGYE